MSDKMNISISRKGTSTVSSNDCMKRAIELFNELKEVSKMNCPTCNSPEPHLHPAVQHGGEVGTCIDEYHLKATNRNKPEYIELVLKARELKSKP